MGYVWMRGLKSALKQAQPDVVHCHDILSLTAYFAALWTKELGYTLVYDNHRAEFNAYQPEKHRLVIAVQKAVYQAFFHTFGHRIRQSADAFVAIGEPEQKYLCELYRLSSVSVPILRLGADTDRFQFSDAGRQCLRREHGWTDQPIVLGHAGTLRASKEVHHLLTVVARLRQTGIDVRLLIVGNGQPSYMQELRQLTRELGLHDLIVFQEFAPLDELPKLLSAMDVAVWPGDISNTAIEAMAVGLPVVACRTPYTEAIIEKYGAGELFKRSDVEDLDRALHSVIDNTARRLDMAARARAAVVKELNWHRIAAQFIELYIDKRNGRQK
jgi:glycosyltransferase involved in cell wall biosynthesis